MEPAFIKPIKIGSLRKIDSKKIVNAFLEQPDPEVEVITESTGREFQNVYVALKMFLKRNADLGVSVRMSEKRIILSRTNSESPSGENDEHGDTSAVH